MSQEVRRHANLAGSSSGFYAHVQQNMSTRSQLSRAKMKARVSKVSNAGDPYMAGCAVTLCFLITQMCVRSYLGKPEQLLRFTSTQH